MTNVSGIRTSIWKVRKSFLQEGSTHSMETVQSSPVGSQHQKTMSTADANLPTYSGRTGILPFQINVREDTNRKHRRRCL